MIDGFVRIDVVHHSNLVAALHSTAREALHADCVATEAVRRIERSRKTEFEGAHAAAPSMASITARALASQLSAFARANALREHAEWNS